ncbi:MAG: FecR domain-containing protein [Spirochaetes bacterium]|nr:FecR domain-containing protein [Spirochaetota bacterium]
MGTFFCFRKSFFLLIILGGLIIGISTVGYPLEVTYLIGDVKLQRASKIIPLTLETKLEAGDIISTGKKSLCTLKYNDGSVVEVRAESKIAIGNETVKGTNYVSLISGIVHGKFVKMQKSGVGNKIYTPTATCAIRGTEFSIAAAGAGDSKIQLEEGMVEIRNPFGKVTIGEGENAEIGVAEKPIAVESEEDLAAWNSRQTASFQKAPEETANKYGIYVAKLDKNSKISSKQINNLEKNLTRNTIKGKGALEKSNEEIEKLDESVQDEMYLNRNARFALDNIIQGLGQDKEVLYNKFLVVKEECNRVAEQQRRNYEALQAVKEAYRKAYEAILKTHRDVMKNIKGQ